MNAPIQTAVSLEPRPLFGIGTVARLTGLKSDTLRVWERRYGLGASYKSPTGRRQYTQSDLDHLQLVAALVKQGVRIGEIAASDRKTLEVLLEQQGSTSARTHAGPQAGHQARTPRQEPKPDHTAGHQTRTPHEDPAEDPR